jgi:hypothetical protein
MAARTTKRVAKANRSGPTPGRLADQLSTELAGAMAATGTAEPELAAALAVAAYRTVHLEAVRRILAGPRRHNGCRTAPSPDPLGAQRGRPGDVINRIGGFV